MRSGTWCPLPTFHCWFNTCAIWLTLLPTLPSWPNMRMNKARSGFAFGVTGVDLVIVTRTKSLTVNPCSWASSSNRFFSSPVNLMCNRLVLCQGRFCFVSFINHVFLFPAGGSREVAIPPCKIGAGKHVCTQPTSCGKQRRSYVLVLLRFCFSFIALILLVYGL